MPRAALTVPLALLVACAPLEDDPELAAVDQELADGGAPVPPPPPPPRAHLIVSGADRNGYLVGPDLAVTLAASLPAGTDPGAVTVRFNGQSRRGMAVHTIPAMPMGFVQLESPFTGFAPHVEATAGPASYVGTTLQCAAMRQMPLVSATDYAHVRVLAVDGDREVIADETHGQSLWYWLGAPCYRYGPNGVTGDFVGYILSIDSAPRLARIFIAADTRWFVDNMLRVARLRRQQGAGFQIATRAQNGAAMCLDVPNANPYDRAPINVYPCHGGANQRFYLEAGNPSGEAWVSGATGACVDVPAGSTQPLLGLQMVRCNGGRNQLFVDNGGGLRSPLSSSRFIVGPNAGRYALCLQPSAGASSASSRLEQDRCSFLPATTFEQWSVTAL
jgi:hypothetical protein